MPMMEVSRFLFSGFQPTDNLRAFVNSQLEAVVEKGPSDAASTARLMKTELGYAASICLSTGNGVFMASTLAEDPARAVRAIALKIGRQLVDWRKTRFDGVRDLP